uniref:Uncharacterized protein n=1 Tax=Gopherus agassizii TaxID=38772 RepID=A0A452HE16_9SAUR
MSRQLNARVGGCSRGFSSVSAIVSSGDRSSCTPLSRGRSRHCVFGSRSLYDLDWTKSISNSLIGGGCAEHWPNFTPIDIAGETGAGLRQQRMLSKVPPRASTNARIAQELQTALIGKTSLKQEN